MEESRKQTEKYPTREAIDVEKKVLTEIGE